MSWITGIDPSSNKLALVTTDLQGHHLMSATYDLSKAGTHHRKCMLAAHKIDNYFKDFGGKHFVFLEAPFISPKTARAIVPLCRVGGAISAGLGAHNDVQFNMVNIMVWKAKIIGKGNADKDYVTAVMKDKWPTLYTKVTYEKNDVLHVDQDLIDAGAINMYGRSAIAFRRTLKKRINATK